MPPSLLVDWCPPNEPWASMQFARYAPSSDPAWSPLVIVGAEILAPEDAARGSHAWCGESKAPILWRAADGEELLRVAHQCGGGACRQRYVIGVPVPLRVKLDVLPLLGDEPSLESLWHVNRELARHGLTIRRTFRRAVEAFIAAECVDIAAFRELSSVSIPDNPNELFARGFGPWPEETRVFIGFRSSVLPPWIHRS